MSVDDRSKRVRVGLTFALLSMQSIVGLPQEVAAIDVQDEPRHHLVFQNESIKIFDVNILVGDVTEYHRHRRANVAIFMSDADLAAQGLDEAQSPTRSVKVGAMGLARVSGDGYVHRVANTGNTALHIIDIEFLQPTGKATAAQSDTYKAAGENEYYRAYILTLAPDQSSLPLKIGPGVRVVLTDSRLDQIRDGGVATVVGGAAQLWQWRDRGSYVLKNISSSPTTVIELEVK